MSISPWGTSSKHSSSTQPFPLKDRPCKVFCPGTHCCFKAPDSPGKVCVLSHVRLFCDPLVDCGCQTPLSMGFFRQGYWSELPFPPPGDLSDLGIKPESFYYHKIMVVVVSYIKHIYRLHWVLLSVCRLSCSAACVILVPGIEPTSHALVLTSGPPGKFSLLFLKKERKGKFYLSQI